ncbi:MAG: AmmeMemoRadiSam system protein B [Alphaproteobacteria bacterium]|nr:AmmeMemoRadiSam system protein B [Alphaproteobacteria bacterium]
MPRKHPLLYLTVIAVCLGLASLAAYAKWNSSQTMQPSNHAGQTRPPYVAGTFYPSDPSQLRETVAACFAKAPQTAIKGPVFALIAPHAGYQFSGPIAAHAFGLIRGHSYKRVVVIAPSHTQSFPYASIYDGDAYETPLGKISIDKPFAKALTKTDNLLKFSETGHGCVMGRCEHALEVELPFLQEVLGDFKLVPIVMGDTSYEMARAVGVALAEQIALDDNARKPDTLIVASSDLSHYHPYLEANALDGKVLGAIAQGDYLSLSINARSRVWEACGSGPIVAAMIAAERLGAKSSVVLARGNSGDTTGDRSRVVGYGAMALFRFDGEAGAQTTPDFSLTASEQKQLLELARDSVEAAVLGKKKPAVSDDLYPTLQTPRGAFVTLKEDGKLRGCIGYITPSDPLAETVRGAAAMAATKDSRFSPVKAEELGKIDYEISVLSPLRRVSSISDVRIGRDGLLIKKGFSQGLLLPQVPTEQGWTDPETFAAQTSVKAGLPPDAWKDKRADLFSFSAFVFGNR